MYCGIQDGSMGFRGFSDFNVPQPTAGFMYSFRSPQGCRSCQDLSRHQQEVTDGQLATMSLAPSTVDSDVASACHLCPPPPIPRRGRCTQQLRALCLETDSFFFFPVTGKKKNRKDAFVRVCYTFFLLLCRHTASAPSALGTHTGGVQ